MKSIEAFVEKLKDAFPRVKVSAIEKKYRADFGDGSYVDIHMTVEEEDFAVHYQRNDGYFMRWNNAHDPNDPHIHVGKTNVEQTIYKDIYGGDENKIIETLKLVKMLEQNGEL